MAEADPARRHWIVAASAAGGIGVAATAVPFVASMAPSERARALGAPVEVDVARVGPGELLSVAWRGKPVWALHRTPAMLNALGGHDRLLADPGSTRPEQQPEYARNQWRSSRPEILVLVALCTHTPRLRPDVPPGAWCRRHRCLVAGRLLLSLPRLEIRSRRPCLQERTRAKQSRGTALPRYVDASRLLIGVDPTA